MKKKILRVSVSIFAGFAILLLFTGIYLRYYLPNIRVRELKVEITRERIERGKYLANHVLACVDCHSKRDWSKYAGPIVPGTEGMGGEVFDQSMGFPGRYIAANITPYSLASWSDGEIYRAITSGVGKRNNTIFPVMPFHAYGTLDDEDIYCVIAYLRSIPSIKNDVPSSRSDFPVNFLINTMAEEGHPSKRPSPQDSLAYGRYIATAAACLDCHTPIDGKGNIILEKAYTGGREFPTEGGGTSVSINLTPDIKTGIGEWEKEMFIMKFKKYDLTRYKPPDVGKGDFNTPMPWTMYAGMDSTDLIAIYCYLKSLPAVRNKVAKSKPVSI